MSRKVFIVVTCLLISSLGAAGASDPPSEWDWREMGYVTPAKNTGMCLSDWVFASVGAVESRILIDPPVPTPPTDLSEQHVLSCNPLNDLGCRGGSSRKALEFMLDAGVFSEECFPYQEDDQVACDPCDDDPVYVFDQVIEDRWSFGSAYQDARAQQIKAQLIEYGPGVVYVEFSSALRNYYGGVYRQPEPLGWNPYVTAMLLVGYNDAGGYWILKYSFGDLWGEAGFINIAYFDAMKTELLWFLSPSIQDLVCRDADGDGYGEPGSPACPSGDATDCDDSDATVYPGAEEVCDGKDGDCDGELPPDEADADGDGSMLCEGDCDDDDATAYPGAAEIYDGVDNDCDDEIDEDFDDDGDGVPNFNDDCPGTPDGVGVGPDGCAVCFIDGASDSDGDGVGDADDECPDSMLDGTVVIGDCDSGVENAVTADGCSIVDLVENCVEGARNHGAFVACVTHAAIKLRNARLITWKEKGRLVKCAARSDLP